MAFDPAPRQSLAAASVKVPSPNTGRYSWFIAPINWQFVLLIHEVNNNSAHLPDSVAAKMAASAFLTTGNTHGFPSAVRYAPTPRFTWGNKLNWRKSWGITKICIWCTLCTILGDTSDLIWMGVVLKVSGEFEDFDGRSHLHRGEQRRHLGNLKCRYVWLCTLASRKMQA